MTYTPSIEERILRKKFGDRVETARKAKGLTQEDLAEMLGVKNAQTVCNWENGAYFPKQFDTVVRIADCLGCDIDYLTGRLDESTHDIQFVHEFTGLSEEAIQKIKQYPYGELLSSLIESDEFFNLMKSYRTFLVSAQKLSTADIDEPPFEQDDGDKVILSRNEATHHFMRKVSVAMTHICEEEYYKCMEEALKNAHRKKLEHFDLIAKEIRKKQRRE